MLYFSTEQNVKSLISSKRKKKQITIGEILGVSYGVKGLNYFFEGICIALRKKKLVHPETSFVLRNVLLTTGVEVTFSYFYNMAFSLRINVYKRKRFAYNTAKLWYVRNKLNKFSRVRV